MKKFLMFICAVTLVFGMVGTANANLIQNGDFETGDLTSWTRSGDVIVESSSSSDALSGMTGWYAILGKNVPDQISTLSQGFTTSADWLTVSFDWSFADMDLDAHAEDVFLSFVRDVGTPAHDITYFELVSQSIVFENHGSYSGLIDISAFTNSSGSAGVAFQLIEAAGVAVFSAAGIDNVDISEAAPVPEPSTILLLGTGLLGLVGYGRKRFSKKS